MRLRPGLLILALFAAEILAQAPAGPPETRRDNVREVIHGVEIVDPYRWLEDQESPETRAWIEAQNAYAHAHLDRLPWRPAIAERLAELMKIDRVSLPIERQGRYFLWKKRAEDDLWILYLRRGDTAFYAYQSYTAPRTVYRYDVAEGSSSVWARDAVPFDGAGFDTRQVWYRSKDGTRVPMFLVHRRGLPPNGRQPTLLYGYGGFNVSLTPRFRALSALWVERGGLYAVANLRGGGEFGEAWHRAGMLENKQNVFDDFIAAAEWLIDNEYTTPARLAIAYSPYHRVKAGTKYPAVLLTSGDFDTRVPPLQARKMTALLQSSTAAERPILLLYDTRAGHSGGKPFRKVVEDLSLEAAFLFWQLGVVTPEPAPPESP